MYRGALLLLLEQDSLLPTGSPDKDCSPIWIEGLLEPAGSPEKSCSSVEVVGVRTQGMSMVGAVMERCEKARKQKKSGMRKQGDSAKDRKTEKTCFGSKTWRLFRPQNASKCQNRHCYCAGTRVSDKFLLCALAPRWWAVRPQNSQLYRPGNPVIVDPDQNGSTMLL